jgi:FkbM family methyltransferase
MSVVDFLGGTRERYRRAPTAAATRETLAELRRGLRRRHDHLRFRLVGKRILTTEVAGVDARFYAENPTEAERARTLNREEAVADWLFTECGPETVFWDVGAYQGHYSVLAFLQGADIVAFDPVGEHRMRLWENLALNAPLWLVHDCFPKADGDILDRIDVHNDALSDANTKAAFGGVGSNEYSVGKGDRRVDTKRGDTVDAPAPDLLKIDVEGHEVAVLDGLEETLLTVDRVAIEIHDGVSIRALTTRLEAAGLDVTELPTPRTQTYIGGVRR